MDWNVIGCKLGASGLGELWVVKVDCKPYCYWCIPSKFKASFGLNKVNNGLGE